ncbi:MAG: cell division FtsK/SpoIIIE, DNA segregation ATPase FtsK/SpoIIIE, S-DNA-T family, partial [Microgenomates group bacterium GW2011_GWC1_39_7]
NLCMARRKYRRRKPFKVKLKKTTIYTLFSILSIAFGGALFASYTKGNEILTELNVYLTSYFGPLSLTVPINVILFGFLLTRIRASFTKANVFFGFLLLTLALMGLFQSGQVGEKIFQISNSIFGSILTILLFAAATLVGLVVFLNLSLGQVFEGIKGMFKLLSILINKISPLFKSKKQFAVSNMKQITIKGLKEEEINKEPPRPLPKAKKGEMADTLVLNKPLEMGVWEYPPLSLLSVHAGKRDTGDVKKIAAIIERTLQSFGIQSRVSEINVGPSVTQYALEIALGTKLSKITALANDLALATEAPTGQIRIEAPIPGRNLVGIEIPNRSLEIVSLKTMLESAPLQKAKSKLAVPLGLDVSGNAVVADLSRMPHILVAGTTGSGKSVLINSVISSILFRASPSEVKMILIDPKRVELTGYNGIPHLLTPVVVETDQCVSALKWAMKEMDRRYVKFQDSGVKNIESYNELAGFQALPYIVIFIDELADLMTLAAAEVEDSIARLAQMARATGIHLVLSTQRPSVDVLTGLIKANIPCRVSFNVSSMVDSKVIIDQPGAEKLLGRGDMLYVPPEQAKPTRIQGTFVSDQEVKRLVNFIKSRGIPVQYTTEVIEQQVNLGRRGVIGGSGAGSGRDDYFEQAVRIVCMHDRASSSLLQRRLSVGFNRAARILEQLEDAGVVGPGDGSKPRDVLIKDPDQFLSQM